MIKGTQKRVIVVKSPDPKFFEEAIFILKDEVFAPGCNSTDLMRQAARVADAYVNEKRKKRITEL